MDNILDLRKIIGILRKHWTLIVLTMIGFAVVAFGIAEFVITPKYTSTTEILVNQKKDDNGNTGAAYENQQADVQMISTYKDIITNEVILKQVKNELKNPTKVIKPAQKATYKTLADGTKKLTKASSPAVVKANGEKYDVTVPELKNDITITSEQNSQVFSLKVQSNDPEKSAVIANKVASVFKTKIKNIMSINNVTIVSKATENTNKTSPNTKLFVMAGLVIGLLVSVFYAFAIELTDTTIKDDEFMTETLGLTNLGAIAQIKGDYHKNNLRNDRKKSDHRRVRV